MIQLNLIFHGLVIHVTGTTKIIMVISEKWQVCNVSYSKPINGEQNQQLAIL